MPIGNRTRDLPACNAAPQPTATPRALIFEGTNVVFVVFTVAPYILILYSLLFIQLMHNQIAVEMLTFTLTLR